MKKQQKLLVYALAITCFALVACSPKKIEKDSKLEEGNIEKEIGMESLQRNIIELPEESGTVSELPWETDAKFKEAMDKNDTKVLMSAYCTVLKDPLPGEEYNVHLAADALSGIIIPAGEIFSQNSSIGPYDENNGYKKGPTYMGSQVTTTVGGGVCKIASTLYNVSILGNLEVVERYNHTMPVPYVPYGQDATVAYGYKDFRFKNNTDSPILIWAKGIENRLYIAFYSKNEAPKVEWHHETLETREANTEYQHNPELNEGEEKVIIKGMDGALIKSWVTIESKDGTKETKELGNSSYTPMPHVVETNK